jgi:hypothetical protein
MKALARTGMMVTETSSEARRAKATVRERGRKNLLTMPPTRPRGTKTAVVVSVEEVIALATSSAPLSAASWGP